MDRDDISPNLVHFIRGERYEDAFATLKKILKERTMLGGTGYIKGEFRCVCFSEAPVHHLGRALTEPSIHKKFYRPFGILISKKWLFAQGGRPVIYQSDGEYDTLPDAIKWRHVRYEPDTEPPVDFSWEREWRIHVNSLAINPEVARIVFPTGEWQRKILNEHDRENSFHIQMYELVVGDSARQMVRDFEWDAEIIHKVEQTFDDNFDF